MLLKILVSLVCAGSISYTESIKLDHVDVAPGVFSINADNNGGPSRVKRSLVEMTDTWRELILQTHNDARQNVHPPASNMQVMTVDETLENYAENMASTCDALIPPEWNDLGVLFWIDANIGVNSLLELQRASIQQNTEAFDYEGRDCSSQCSDDILTTIWHDVNTVGCAIGSCDTFSVYTDVLILVCVYTYEPEYRDNTEANNLPYVTGYPCSYCDFDFPVCDANYSLCPNQVPASLELLTQPGPQNNPAGQPFAIQPELALYDENGDLYTGLANPACPWYVGVIFGFGSHPHANIIGMREVPVVDGIATFVDLGISEYGEYELNFFVSLPPIDPTKKFLACSDTITISPPLDTIGECTVQEGAPRFERSYEWGTDCSSVCIGDCSEQHQWCVDLEMCGPHAGCENSECVCNDIQHFDYDIFDEDNLATTLSPVVLCMPDYIEIRLDKCGFNALGYKLADLYILGPGGEFEINPYEDIDKQMYPFIQSCAYNDCRGYVTADEYGLAYSMVVRGNFADCHGLVESNETHITYTHAVRGYGGWTNGIISRKRPIEVEFSCSYSKRLSTTSLIHVIPFIKTVSLSIASEGEFSVNLVLMTDSNYNTPYTSAPIIWVPGEIYVEIFPSDLDTEGVILYADKCHATPTNDADDTVYQDLIVDGCPADSTVMIPQNGEGEQVMFNFQSFVFNDNEDTTTLFIHCFVRVCLVDMAPCTTSCVSRRRRSVTEDPDNVSATVSLGPIKIKKGNEERKKRSSNSNRYSSSFSHEYATQELANPPFARTTGLGSFTVSYN